MKSGTKLMAAAIAALAIFFTTNVNAQTAPAKDQTAPADAWHLGIGVEAGIPTGNGTDISNFAAGGTVRLQYNASSDFALMLTTGYYEMTGKAIPEFPGKNFKSLGILPVKFGVKYFVATDFYLDGEAGLSFESSFSTNTKLILSPGIGYDNNSWDIGLRYENYSGQNNSFGLVGLRVGYAFGL